MMEFLSPDHLLTIREVTLDMEFIMSYEHLHNNLPFSILYVLDEHDHLSGIFSLREYKKSLIQNMPVINRDFLHINGSGDERSDYEAAAAFHLQRPKVLNLPLVLDNKLAGEFSFHEVTGDISYLFEWDLLDPGIVLECRKKRERNGITILNMSQYHELIRDRFRNKITSVPEKSESEYDLYMECLLLHILHRFRRADIRFLYFEGPTLRRLKDLPATIRQNIDSPDTIDSFLHGKDFPVLYRDFEQSRKYLEAGEYKNIRFIYIDHHYELADHQSETCNILNGKRMTCDHSDIARNQLAVFGVCVARGATVADCDTVESILQNMINRDRDGSYNVVNYGVAEGVTGAAINDFQYILHTPFRSGDIVICLSEYDARTCQLLENNGVEIIHTSNLYERETKRWFVDTPLHLTPKANVRLAKHVYEKLEGKWAQSDLSVQGQNPPCLLYDNEKSNEGQITDQQIRKWTDTIKRSLQQQGVRLTERTGAIVANCNPFTCGHLYLMETASRLVDILLIFVVEEDKSRFPFKDRIDLVRKGVRHLDNAYVFPSGRYIISSVTFPEYFEKNDLQDTSVNTTLDVRIFGQYIAPALNITVRFVGEEPFDSVTREYNRTMHEVLSDYGVELYEIPRAMNGEITISASYVRKLLSENSWDQIRSLVPPSTYEYLKQHGTPH